MAAQRYFVAWEKDVSRESWLIWSGPKFSLSLSSFPSVSSPLEKKAYFRTFSHGTTLSTDNVGIGETRGVSQFSIYIYICGVSYEPSSTRFASFEKFVHFEIFVCTFRILTFQSNFLTLIFISFALFNYLFNYLLYNLFIYFFYITRKFKIHRTFWNLCSNFRAIKIYIFTIFMNIYLKKIALRYILIFTLNAITVR